MNMAKTAHWPTVLVVLVFVLAILGVYHLMARR